MTGSTLLRAHRLPLALIAAATLAALIALWPSFAQPSRSQPVRVTGTLVALAAGDDRRNRIEIELPDARVFAVDGRQQRHGATATGLDGRFELFVPGGRSYRLCYEVGSVSECGPTVRAVRETVALQRIPLRVRASLHGRVLTGDGRPCWMSDPFFGVDVSTQVSASQSVTGRPVAAGRANVQGEYAFFRLRRGRYALSARCEASLATGVAEVRAAPGQRDLTLPNRAPVIRRAAAFEGTVARTRAETGAALDLRADVIDPEGHVIQYEWRALDGSGQLLAAGGPAGQWQVNAEPGLRSVYLLARDGRGGFAFRRIDLEGSRQAGVSVSGRAIDELTGAPVAGAEVTFGSARGRTDAGGWFQLESQRREGDRYVLNIDHPGYALTSRILDRGARGDTYEMIPVQATTAMADNEIRLSDRTSGALCERQNLAGRQRPLVRRAQRRVVEEAAGEPAERPSAERLLALARATEPRCLERGAEIRIPAGALVDARGRLARGSVRAAVATLDPARRSLPGDYRARGRAGESALLSYGAVDVEFTDANGRPLQLRPGAAAEVRIPVPPSQVATARPAIMMWSYDEQNGVWIPEGEARLETIAGGSFYVGATRHFSTINMDIELNVANATCVRVELDPAFNAWTNKVLRAYATFSGTSSQVKEIALDNNQYHGIFALPFGTAFPPNTLRLELRGTFNGVQQVLLDDIINTDARPRMTGSNLFPPYPYDECGAPILLSPAPGVVPAYGDIDAAGRPAFLTGPGGLFNPNPPQATAYYAEIDPGNAKTTLGDWWQANGFGTDGLQSSPNSGTFSRASYMNHNDLGFGRDMHCLQPGSGRLACYVTNYGLPDQNPQNANDAASRNPATRGATVAMEFDPAAGAAAVQFYVYGGGTASAPRLEFADLDGLGPKPVPHLCMVCHGGNFVANRVEHARFREFDLPSFRYLGGAAWNFGQAAPAGLDGPSFATLNRMVRDIHNGTPIGNVINAWYPSGFGGGPLPVLPTPPAGWAAAAAGYHNVYGQSCRTCHIARDEGNPNAFYVFNSLAAFDNTGYAVCGFGVPKRRVMPNAFITYRNFWADTPRVQQFEALTSEANCGS